MKQLSCQLNYTIKLVDKSLNLITIKTMTFAKKRLRLKASFF